MTPLRTMDPLKIGIVAVVLAALAVVFVFRAGALGFGERVCVAHFEHTAGLRVGEDVTVAGARVGEVRSISLGAHDVIVEFTVEDHIRLGARTRAEIEVATLLGTHLLAVAPAGGGELADDTIPLSATSVPYNLQDIVDRGSASLDELDPELLSDTLDEVGRTMASAQPDLAAALDGVSAVSEVVLTRADQADALVRAAGDVTRRLNANSTEIVSLMKQSNAVMSELQSRREAIRRLLADAQRLTTTLQRVVSENQRDLDVALTKLAAVIKGLRAQEKELSAALDVLGPSARYLANATGNGPWIDIRPDDRALPDGLTCELKGLC
ncbi:MCE family protein [Nocardioides sp. KC13]|uniref:MCE family protein n=1 Tax=Nocardioides turkmenicus TaxID=2711220 RepID=A0A6M1QWA8_9ACTN|nr:MCE family protein [Nocardioides sp. KC13]NGN94233.1 MCE family protein [Nocardioides sp. KC13]